MSVADGVTSARVPAADTWESAVAALLRNPEHRTLVRDCYFDGTPAEAGCRYWQSDEWAAVRELLGPSRGTVLDIGAGRGIASYALSRDGWTVTALEPDPSALVGAGAIRQMAAASGFNIEVIEAFGERLPFADESFDLVLARQALHHAHDLGAFARELFRVLRPGGRLVAIRDHVISRRGDLQEFFAVHPLHRFYGGENAHLLADYTGHLTAAGFGPVRVIGPFESVINYAPHSRESLAEAIAARVPRAMGMRRLAHAVLRQQLLFDATLHLLGFLDRRPGRLCSFVARKRAG